MTSEEPEASLLQLESGSRDREVIKSFAVSLDDLEGPGRVAAIDRAQRALAGDADSLVELGRQLARQDFAGRDLWTSRVIANALEVDPTNDDGITLLANTLKHVPRQDGEGIVDAALTATERDPRLLVTKARLLADDRPEEAEELASEAAEASLTRLQSDPSDRLAIQSVVFSLKHMSPSQRVATVDRARATLAADAESLVDLGQRLHLQGFAGSELLGARTLASAFAVDPTISGCAELLADALRVVPRSDGEPLLDDALERTGRNPHLLAAKARFLAEDDAAAADAVAAEAFEASLLRLETEPSDHSALVAVVASLEPMKASHLGAAVARVEWALSSDAASLQTFGAAICDVQSLARRGYWGARALISALQADPGIEGGFAHLSDALALARTEGGSRDAKEGGIHEDTPAYVSLASDALEVSLERLEAVPSDQDAISSFVASLALYGPLTQTSPAQYAEIVHRAQQALRGNTHHLETLGRTLYNDSFPHCELLGAQMAIAALEIDSAFADGVSLLLSTLGYLSKADGEPLVDTALVLTDRDPQLSLVWGNRLVMLGVPAEAEHRLLDAVRRDRSLLVEATDAISGYYYSRRLLNRLSRWLDRVEAATGRHPNITYWRGELLRLRGQPHKTVPLLEEALASAELDPSLREAIVETLFLARIDLRHDDEIAAMLDSLDAGAETQWISAADGRSKILLWRVRAALRFHDRRGAYRWLQILVEIEDQVDLSPVNRARRDLASLTLDHGTSLLSDIDCSVDSLRLAASDIVDPDCLVAIRLESISRTNGEPDSARCGMYFELGTDLDELRRYGEAQHAYERAHELFAGPAESENFWQYGPYALHNSAAAFEQAGNFERGSQTWQRATEEYDAALPTDDPYFHWARSSAHFRLDRLDVAYMAALTGLEGDDEHIELLLRLVELRKEWHASRGRRNRESHAQSAGVPRNNGHPDESLAWRTRDASRVVRQILIDRADQSRNVEHHRACASFLLEQSDYNKARHYIDEALRLEPDGARNHILSAQWYERDGKRPEALRAYQAALELEPDDLPTRSALGHLHANLGDREAARIELSHVHDIAPAHVETLIRLADIYTDLGDQTDDVAYEKAIAFYDAALRHHRRSSGSKFLSTSEMASVLYQRGYCKVKLYEATPNARRSRQFLSSAIADFDECLGVDESHDKARVAKRSLTTRSARLLLSRRERYGPWLVVVCALFVFVLAQVRYLAGDLSATADAALSLGGIALIIAGLVLPELLKLKVGGIELEKSSVEQQARPTTFNLSR